jgi:hypothetical protein
MKDLVKKVAVGLSTGALVAQSLVLPAFAEIQVVVSGNGTGTQNAAGVNVSNTTTVTQNNTANVSNNISASSNTGNNDANDNTGDGEVSVDTGNAEANVSVTNAVNSNEAHVDCGGCPSDVSVVIEDNGSHSENAVDLDLSNTTWVDQNNEADLDNNVDVWANTGYNDANDNTGDGEVSVDTGNAKANATVSNMANANVAFVGGDGEGALELIISGNGTDTLNYIDADLANTLTVQQNNDADIENDVEVGANTGKNDTNDNTGDGGVSIDTGDAEAGATVDNAVNFNFANVADCCFLSGLVKIADNGSEAESAIDLDLASTLYASQENAFDCEGGNEPKSGSLFDLLSGGRRGDDCNDVDAHANTGDNDSEDNTSGGEGDPEIDTGNASTEVEVSNEANQNVFSTGDAEHPDWDDWDMDSHGLLVWLLAMMTG